VGGWVDGCMDGCLVGKKFWRRFLWNFCCWILTYYKNIFRQKSSSHFPFVEQKIWLLFLSLSNSREKTGFCTQEYCKWQEKHKFDRLRLMQVPPKEFLLQFLFLLVFRSWDPKNRINMGELPSTFLPTNHPSMTSHTTHWIKESQKIMYVMKKFLVSVCHRID
jgi:hypothetical protein